TNAACCSGGTGSSPSGTRSSPTSRINSAAPQPPGPKPRGGPTTRWSRGGGGRGGVEQSRRPHGHLAAAQVAESAGQPVVVDVHGLEDVALALDLQPLEGQAGLAVVVAERTAPGGALDELVDRGRNRAGGGGDGPGRGGHRRVSLAGTQAARR